MSKNYILSPKQSLIRLEVIGYLIAVEMTTICDPKEWLVWLAWQEC